MSDAVSAAGAVAAWPLNPCVLVVDDEAAIREELLDWLTLRGVACHGAAGAAAAKAVLAAQPAVTVLLTDLNMPGTNGIALALDVLAGRSEEHALEVVVLTAHATADHAIDALRARAIDFVAKPPVLPLLIAALDRAHASAARRRQGYAQTAALLAKLERSVQALRDATGGDGAPPDALAAALPAGLLALMRQEILSALYRMLGLSSLVRRAAATLPSSELQEYAQSMLQAGTVLSERTRALLKVASASGALPADDALPPLGLTERTG